MGSTTLVLKAEPMSLLRQKDELAVLSPRLSVDGWIDGWMDMIFNKGVTWI